MQERTSGTSDGAVEAEQAKEPGLELADGGAAATETELAASPPPQTTTAIADDIAEDDSDAEVSAVRKLMTDDDALRLAGEDDDAGAGAADVLHSQAAGDQDSEAEAGAGASVDVDVDVDLIESAQQEERDGGTAGTPSASVALAASHESETTTAAETAPAAEDSRIPEAEVALEGESVDVAIETDAEAEEPEPQVFAATEMSASAGAANASAGGPDESASASAAANLESHETGEAAALEGDAPNGSSDGSGIALVDAVTAALDAERARVGEADANQGVPDPMSPWDIGAIVLKAGEVGASARAGGGKIAADADAEFEAPDDGPTTLGEDAEPMILADGSADALESADDSPPPSDDASVLERGDTVIAPLPPEFLAANAAEAASAAVLAAAAPTAPNPKLTRTLPPPSRLSGTASQLRIPTPAPIMVEAARRTTPTASPALPAAPPAKKPGRTILGLGLADILDVPALARRAGATARNKKVAKVAVQPNKVRARTAKPRPSRGTTTAAFWARARAQLRRTARGARVLANRVQVTTLTLSSMIAATFVGGLLVGRAVWKNPDAGAQPPVAAVTATPAAAPIGVSVPTVLPIQPTAAAPTAGTTTTAAAPLAPAPGANVAAVAPSGSVAAPAASAPQAQVAAAAPTTPPPVPPAGSITIVPTVTESAAPAEPPPQTRARASRPRRSPSLSDDGTLATGSRPAATATTVARSAPLAKGAPKRKYTWVDPFAD